MTVKELTNLTTFTSLMILSNMIEHEFIKAGHSLKLKDCIGD